MYWNDLHLQDAPQKGRMLAYTRQNVEFVPYGSLDEAESIMAGREMVELHLFDDDKEYRAIASISPRFPGGIIETVADFPAGDEENVYAEEVVLEKDMGTMTVLNHISYNESGMAAVDNYRLRMGGMR